MSERIRSLPTLAFVLITLVLATSASAHFLLNLNVRIIHIEHQSDGLSVYLRTPMPYLVADKLGETDGDELPAPAPFTTNAREGGQLVHFVDLEAVAAEPLGLGQIAEDGLSLVVDGARLRGSVDTLRLHRVGTEPGFATLDEAKLAVAEGAMPSSPLFVGDTVADIVIRYVADTRIRSYSISSTLDPGLPGQEMTANLILDYGGDTPKVFRSRGLMLEPVEVTQSHMGAFVSFVWEGVRHILEGLDHVLFVVCLVIGATALRSLLWRVTGFTLGHSVTLALGFFGFVPTGAWFIPAVETGIALSIIYAAWTALRGDAHSTEAESRILVITILIGLLHGLGFSFVLQEILQVSSPNIWQSLLAFNVGVEIGQLSIVLLIWPAMALLRRANVKAWRIAKTGLAVGCSIVAGVWTFERVGQVLASLS